MTHSNDPQLSLILDRFDRERAKGNVPPEIGSYLPAAGDASRLPRRELLIELVMIDLERRWRSGGGELPTIAVDRESALEATLDVVPGSDPSGSEQSPFARPISASSDRATALQCFSGRFLDHSSV